MPEVVEPSAGQRGVAAVAEVRPGLWYLADDPRAPCLGLLVCTPLGPHQTSDVARCSVTYFGPDARPVISSLILFRLYDEGLVLDTLVATDLVPLPFSSIPEFPSGCAGGGG